MYSHWQIASKYLSYYLKASNAKGHGVHSPFVFDFIIHVLKSKEKPEAVFLIENYRQRLLKERRNIEVEDFGAGSSVMHTKERKVSDIAATSLKRKKYASLLYRIAKYYRSKHIVELGTSLGTTTAYLASGSPDSQVITLEGSGKISDIAEDFFEHTSFNNIHLVRGDFKKTLPTIIHQIPAVDLVFIDGNHQEEPTVDYFNSFLTKSHNDTILVFDDIHWSGGMEKAWERIKQHPDVSLTIDLFFIGLVFLKKEFLVKQHFVVRF